MLQQAIGSVLSFAVVVAISPIPIIGVVLMLGTPRARSNGPAFLAGWLLGLSVVGVVVLLVAKGAGADDDGGASSGVSWLKIVLGLVLIALAVRQWRRRPRGDEAGTLPKWMEAIDQFTAGRAAAMGVALSAVNPKNLLMTIGASVAIVQTGASTADKFVALAVFVVIGTMGVGVPLVLYFVMGERAVQVLDGLKTWLAAHNNAVMAVLLLVIGAKLLGDGISIA
jgi:threonine/homoserine/homoserine lactone efflux protein